MQDNAYNKMISNQVNRINQNYVNRQEMDGKAVKEKNITRNTTRGLQRGKGIATGGNWFDDVVGSIAKVAPLAMMALGKPKKGGKHGDWDTNTELMTSQNLKKGGISTGGCEFLGGIRAIAGDEAMNHVYHAAKAMHGGNWWDDFTTGFAMPFKAIGSVAESVLPVAKLFGKGEYEGGLDPMALLNQWNHLEGGRGGAISELEGAGVGEDFSALLGPIAHFAKSVGMGKKRRVGRPCKGTKIVGMGKKRRVGRPCKATKGGVGLAWKNDPALMHGEGWLDDAIDTVSSAVSKGKKLYDQYAPVVKKGKKLYDQYAPVAKKMYKKARGGISTGGISTGGISTGGISTGGLSRKLLGARAVGGEKHGGNWFESGLENRPGNHMMLGVGRNKGEMRASGWFDDAVGSVVNAVSTLHPIYKEFKHGRGKKAGISTGGKKPSKWLQHVKKYAKENNVSYKDAMKQAKASYH